VQSAPAAYELPARAQLLLAQAQLSPAQAQSAALRPRRRPCVASRRARAAALKNPADFCDYAPRLLAEAVWLAQAQRRPAAARSQRRLRWLNGAVEVV
jgi:hypothetical protein